MLNFKDILLSPRGNAARMTKKINNMVKTCA